MKTSQEKIILLFLFVFFNEDRSGIQPCEANITEQENSSIDNPGNGASNNVNSVLLFYCQNAATTGQKLDKLMQLLCSSLQPDGSISVAAHSKNRNSTNARHEDCTQIPTSYSRAADTIKIDFFELLNEQDELEENEAIDDAILILGNTGSGKTTLTQILAGDLARLHGVLSESGNLVIIDDDNRIGGPSTASKTLKPELVVEKPGNGSGELGTTNFYDCPGFDDTRGADADIATRFFISRILKKLKRVKLLFLANHSSVKLGNERLDFDLLVSHISRFVRSLRKYRNSFGLVVTQVASYSEFGAFQNDEEIVAGIVEFLSVYNETLHGNLESFRGSSKDRGELLQKIYFVETLLERDRYGKYPKISFSRTPEKCGPLSISTEVTKTRKRLMKLYEDELEFSPVDYNDFGYFLKEKAILKINNYTESINLAIGKSFRTILDDFLLWFESSSDLQIAQSNPLQNIILEFNGVVRKLEAAPDLNKFLETFNGFLQTLGYSVSEKFKTFLRQQQAYLEFFSDATDTRRSLANSRQWILSIQQFQQDLSDIEAWQEFLSNLKNELENHDFVGRRKPALLKRSALPRGSDPQGWLEYIQKESIMPVEGRILLIAGRIRKSYAVRLNQLMMYYLKATEMTCVVNKITIKGNFVAFSEFLDIHGQFRHYILEECSEDSVQTLEVYASNTLFIDEDINAEGKELNVVIISPKWVIIGNQMINLNGSEGPGHPKSQAEEGITLWNKPGTDGMHGAAGKPGGAAGSLFGVAKSIQEVAGGSLTITSIGGQGGPGQGGGNGGDGSRGEIGTKEDSTLDSWFTIIVVNEYKKSHKGFPGQPGGNGGNGGVGGMGGLPGRVEIVTGNRNDHLQPLRIVRKSGPRGIAGNGGVAGKGGRHGDPISCYYAKILFVIPIESTCSHFGTSEAPAHDGEHGIPGGNPARLEFPRSPKYSVIEWKSVLNFKLSFYNVDDSETKRFIRILDTTDPLQSYHVNNLESFAAELVSLESLSDRRDHNKEVVALYESFSNRLEKFTESQETLGDGDKKVVTVLLTHAQSKMVLLKGSSLSHHGMVVDVFGYFNLVKDQLNRFRQASALQMIQETKRNFDNRIQEKVEDVQQFISAVLKPSLSTAQEELDFRMISLEKEFETLVLQAEENVNRTKNRIEKGSKWMETLKLRHLLSIIKLGARALNLLGEPEIGYAIEMGVSVVETFIKDGDKDGSSVVKGITEKARDLLHAFNNTMQRSSRGQLQFVDEESFEMDSDSNENKSLRRGDPQRRRNTTLLQDALVYVVGPAVAYSLYNKFNKDQLKLDKLEQAVHDAETMLTTTLDKQKFLQESFIPLVDSMLNYVEKVESHLSHRNGEVSSWQLGMAKLDIQSRLRSIKQSLDSLGVKVQSRIFQSSLDKVQDLITMMIDMYDSMEEFRNTRQLAQFMAALQSASFGTVPVTSDSEEITHLMATLEKNVQENCLAGEVQRAMHAFKMWVFPFAKLYMEEFQEQFGTESQTRDATDLYVTQIERLQQKLERYKAMTLNSQDTHVIHTNFTSALKSSRPFYVWEWNQWSSEIQDLLSGKEVHLKADVRHGHQGGRNAVKFKQIEINLKSKIKSEQAALNDELEHFSVSMTHSGLNYYKFGNEYFVMTTTTGSETNHTIVYNFERDERTGNRLGTNLLYEKFKRGDYLLSPYTLWTVKLMKAFPSKKIKFDKLRRFARNGVDLELVGTGIYIDERQEKNLEGLEVDRYYEKDDSLREELDFNVS